MVESLLIFLVKMLFNFYHSTTRVVAFDLAFYLRVKDKMARGPADEINFRYFGFVPMPADGGFQESAVLVMMLGARRNCTANRKC
jgi:hypothetical protein